jgi:hypothetical protein
MYFRSVAHKTLAPSLTKSTVSVKMDGGMSNDSLDAEEDVGVQDAQGRSISLRLKMIFESRPEATAHIQDFVLAQGKRAVQYRKRSGGNRTVFVCKSKTQCSFEEIAWQSKRKGANGLF